MSRTSPGGGGGCTELGEREVQRLRGQVVDIECEGDDEHTAQGEDHVRGAPVVPGDVEGGEATGDAWGGWGVNGCEGRVNE